MATRTRPQEKPDMSDHDHDATIRDFRPNDPDTRAFAAIGRLSRKCDNRADRFDDRLRALEATVARIEADVKNLTRVVYHGGIPSAAQLSAPPPPQSPAAAPAAAPAPLPEAFALQALTLILHHLTHLTKGVPQ